MDDFLDVPEIKAQLQTLRLFVQQNSPTSLISLPYEIRFATGLETATSEQLLTRECFIWQYHWQKQPWFCTFFFWLNQLDWQYITICDVGRGCSHRWNISGDGHTGWRRVAAVASLSLHYYIITDEDTLPASWMLCMSTSRVSKLTLWSAAWDRFLMPSNKSCRWRQHMSALLLMSSTRASRLMSAHYCCALVLT